jgi:hypothetical protein
MRLNRDRLRKEMNASIPHYDVNEWPRRLNSNQVSPGSQKVRVKLVSGDARIEHELRAKIIPICASAHLFHPKAAIKRPVQIMFAALPRK